VATDCFVHHFGSRSFVANELDYGAQLDEKFEIFRRKWGLAHDARTTGDFQMERMILRGFVPALHFQALPASPHGRTMPLRPWQLEQWLAQGEAGFEAGELDLARRIFEALLKREPGCARAANNLACVFWQGDTDGSGSAVAARILQEILAHDPHNQDAQWNLAELRRAQAAAGEAGAQAEPAEVCQG
jgi:hypothetical protein